ncbi:MAG TPA: response regulator transcription factor [Candidatus Aquicultor sp.]|jgi:DNA-binding response OmpR family regulator
MQTLQQKNVLIIEDDRNIAELVRLYLDDQGWLTRIFVDGGDALNYLKDNHVHVGLVILDLMLPSVDGWEICRWVKENTHIPVIIVTAHGEIQDKLKGFELGTDDYIVKPFDPLEVVARVKAVLRRTGDKPQCLEFPNLSINLDSYTVLVAGEKMELTPREIELLHFLASYPGRVFTRELLLQQLWGFDFPGNTRTVDVHVNRLREKLEAASDSCRITTVWGVGYKFEVGDENAEHIR